MNLLIVGAGKGSWDVRGRQLGDALGARVTSMPLAADWQWADLAILVKRAAVQWAAIARKAGVPVVWDALDFWSQPADNGRTATDARRLLDARIAEIDPVVTIGATEAMAHDARGVCLPHHSWPGLSAAPARETVETIAYEGNAFYIGAWLPALERACAMRGWRFVVNPPDIREADIIVALRHGAWDGWICREWKSGVKVVNALAAGRPLITQDSAAFREIGHAGTVIASESHLDAALDQWALYDARAAVVRESRERAEAYTLQAIASRYAAILAEVGHQCAA